MTADAWQAAATTIRHARDHLARHQPTPHPRPGQPTDAQFARYGRMILGLHQPRQVGLGQMPTCTCGEPLVLCPYRLAAERVFGPPTTPPPVGV